MLILFLLCIAYLLGAIPFGLWIGRYVFHKDLRAFGSGNTGTTNTFRVLGKQAGFVVFACDILKGTLATLLPLLFGLSGLSPLIFGLLAVLGHTFSIFDHFRGGKAVATSAGVILGFSPLFFCSLLVLFLILLYISSMVSFASLVIALVAPLATLVFYQHDPMFIIVIWLLGGFIIYRHRDNIKRIQSKTENLVPFGLNILKQQDKKS